MRARLLLSIGLTAALIACGEDDEESPQPNTPNKQVTSVAIGDAVQLRNSTGHLLRARVARVFDPVRRHPFEDARIVGRFVGVELRLKNEGDIPHRGSPWSGSRLSTTRGAERPTLMLKRGSCVGTVRRVIAPGSPLRLCIPFRVDRGAKLLKYRYSPEGGFSPTAAVWDLRR